MKTKNKQIWIFIQVTVFGIVVAGLGLLVFSLKANNIARQESNPNNDIPQPLQGTITQVEQGKDGVQAELKTEYGLYSVTISMIQTEIVGRFETLDVSRLLQEVSL